MTKPAVSIVIPAYNASEFIGETLTSVVALEYPPALLELIVVDDGSTDDTVDEVRRSLRSCLFQWQVIEQSNAGPARARNIGWRSAQGEWIQFLDADDLLDATKLRIQTETAVKANPDVAVVYSPWQRIAKHGGVWRPVDEICHPRVGEDAVLDLLQTRNFLQLGSQLQRRDWLARIGGFNEACRLIEDVDLSLRMAMAGGRFLLADADRPLLFYRQHDSSLSRESHRGFVDGCVRNALLAETFWKESSATLTVPQRELLVEIYGNALRFYIDEDRGQFRSMLAHVLELDPRYQPGGSGLRILTKLLGHETAEAMAARYRRIRYGSARFCF